MNGREPLSVGSVCAECHMWLEPGEVFHPWVYCLLWKNGVDDPEAHLRDLGFVRDPTAPAATMSAWSVDEWRDAWVAAAQRGDAFKDRAELAEARNAELTAALKDGEDCVYAYHGDPTPGEECAVCIWLNRARAALAGGQKQGPA